MLQSYDEDLLENVFYIALQSKAPDIFHRATTERWMISIPKIGTIPKSAFTEENFKSHILQAIDDRPNSYRTLNEKEVLIQDNAITTGSGFKDIRTVNILFEETFYNKSDESYRVLCINSPLEGGKFEGADAVPVISLQTIEDCTDLLWGHTASRKTKRQLDDLVEFFNESYNRLEGESLRHNMDAAHSVFTRAMQIVLKDNYLKRTSRHSKPYMDSLKTAVETYVMHGIYKKLFKSVRACLAANDSQLNKITRNLSELQLRDLGVRSEFCHNVPKARRELSSINKYTTPLGKLYCVRRAVQAIMQPPKILKKGVEAVPITTDDLLPILIFVVVKSETPNWRANLTFMTNFRFSKSSNDDEFGFYLASLEAVIEHVNSGQLNNIQIGAANPQKLQLSTSPPPSSPGGLWRQDSGGGADTQALDILFQLVKDGKFKQVSDVLSKHQKNIDDTALKLCHPLCSCDKCEALLSRSRSDSSTVTVFSRDDRGYTALHMASASGQSECLSVLIKKGAVVNAADYHGSTPLHLACQRGHKTVALLLLHYKCDLNACDNDGSSPLHLCTANGHEECVRALVEHDQGSGTPIDINASNDAGDTALHLASKWGYESILELLLEHGASVEARNRRKQTPVTCAHNANVQRLLQRASVKIDERRFSFSNVQIEVGTSPSLSIDMMPSPKDRAESSLSNVSTQSYPSTGSEPRETSFGRKEEILLKSVADGDIEMVKYHLGWDIDSDIEDSEDECFDATRELCHPLCQCPKCIPLQKRNSSVTSDGLHINSTNSDGFSPLHVAALHGYEDMSTILIRKGADIDAKTRTSQCSALHLACQMNMPKIVSLLLIHGAKINIKDVRGDTPLHYCALNGCEGPAEVLLKHGASINQTNQRGNTPLHEAAKWHHISIVNLLLQHGAVPGARNRQQLMPMQLAQNDAIIKLLDNALKLVEEHDDLDPPWQQADGAKVSRKGSEVQRLSIKELFAAFEEKDIKQLQQITKSIKKFDAKHKLRRTITRDRSSPRLDFVLKHQLSIQNFKPSRLKRVESFDRSDPILRTSSDIFDKEFTEKDLVDEVPIDNDSVSEQDIEPIIEHELLDIAPGYRCGEASGMDIAIGGEKVEKQKIDSSYAQTEASGSFDKDEPKLTTEENIANKLYDSSPSQTQSFVGVHDPESERLKIDVSSSKIVDNMPNVNSEGVTKISPMVANITDDDNDIEGNALEDDVSETSQTESQLGDDVAPTDVQ